MGYLLTSPLCHVLTCVKNSYLRFVLSLKLRWNKVYYAPFKYDTHTLQLVLRVCFSFVISFCSIRRFDSGKQTTCLPFTLQTFFPFLAHSRKFLPTKCDWREGIPAQRQFKQGGAKSVCVCVCYSYWLTGSQCFLTAHQYHSAAATLKPPTPYNPYPSPLTHPLPLMEFTAHHFPPEHAVEECS